MAFALTAWSAAWLGAGCGGSTAASAEPAAAVVPGSEPAGPVGSADSAPCAGLDPDASGDREALVGCMLREGGYLTVLGFIRLQERLDTFRRMAIDPRLDRFFSGSASQRARLDERLTEIWSATEVLRRVEQAVATSYDAVAARDLLRAIGASLGRRMTEAEAEAVDEAAATEWLSGPESDERQARISAVEALLRARGDADLLRVQIVAPGMHLLRGLGPVLPADPPAPPVAREEFVSQAAASVDIMLPAVAAIASYSLRDFSDEELRGLRASMDSPGRRWMARVLPEALDAAYASIMEELRSELEAMAP